MSVTNDWANMDSGLADLSFTSSTTMLNALYSERVKPLAGLLTNASGSRAIDKRLDKIEG